jgi:hypothetical protein
MMHLHLDPMLLPNDGASGQNCPSLLRIGWSICDVEFGMA